MKDYLFNSVFIKSFDSSDAQFKNGSKLVRFHYTSPSTIISILKNQDERNTALLRFTDARYMNDTSELVIVAKVLFEFLNEHSNDFPHAKEVVEKLLLKNQKKSDFLELKVKNIQFTEIESIPFEKTRYFIFCMSKNSDSLHMWNYYTKNGKYQGFNIGFDVYKFMKSFDSSDKMQADQIGIRYGDVIYQKTKQYKEIELLLKEIEKQNDKIPYKMAHLRNRMEMLAPFFKDINFKDEEEYRVVFAISNDKIHRTTEENEKYRSTYYNDNLKKTKIDFFDRNGVLTPYLSVPVIKEAVKSVTIAPMVEEKIAIESLKEFLDINGYDNVEISKSKIPVRF